MKKCRILVSNTFDPWFNLATEDWIFKDMDADTQTLFLWRNDQTVVIGRFQNPWVECNTKKMEQDAVKLARRQSGGGTVFQDLGNTNFTFLSSKEDFDKKVNNKIITDAINSFGLESYASGRNDIVVEDSEGPKKISGSAFKEKKDRSFHHGTLLIDADLKKLGNYLNPDKKKLEAKGITSVRSRVTNLSVLNSEITHEELCSRIIQGFRDHYQCEAQVEYLDHEYLESIDSLKEYYEALKDWDWRFGETPKFSHQIESRFDWGGVDIHLDCHKGVILKAVIYSDSLHPEMIEELSSNLISKNYTKDGILEAVNETSMKLPMIEDYLCDLKEWLISQIQ